MQLDRVVVCQCAGVEIGDHVLVETGAEYECVVPAAARHLVVAVAAGESVIAAEAIEDVAARGTGYLVVSGEDGRQHRPELVGGNVPIELMERKGHLAELPRR